MLLSFFCSAALSELSGTRSLPLSVLTLFLLWLDTKHEAADGDLLIGGDFNAFAAGHFLAIDEGGVTAFGDQPIVTFRIEREGRMHATDFGVSFDGQIDRDCS